MRGADPQASRVRLTSRILFTCRLTSCVEGCVCPTSAAEFPCMLTFYLIFSSVLTFNNNGWCCLVLCLLKSVHSIPLVVVWRSFSLFGSFVQACANLTVTLLAHNFGEIRFGATAGSQGCLSLISVNQSRRRRPASSGLPGLSTLFRVLIIFN